MGKLCDNYFQCHNQTGGSFDYAHAIIIQILHVVCAPHKHTHTHTHTHTSLLSFLPTIQYMHGSTGLSNKRSEEHNANIALKPHIDELQVF